MARIVQESEQSYEKKFDPELIRQQVVEEKSMFKSGQNMTRIFSDSRALLNKIMGNPDEY